MKNPFTPDFVAYLADLEANNEREWFHAHKARYEKSVKEPFEAFVEDLIARLQKLNPALALTAKDAIFRIARDTRFSKDKTPYKTHMAALLSNSGRKGIHEPGLYLQISPTGVDLYTGAYEPEKEALQRIREEIADRDKDFKALLADKAFKKLWGELQGEKNKRIPKELEEAAQRQPLLYNKQFYFHAQLGKSQVTHPKLAETLVEHYRVAMPLMAFFQKPMVG
jgi:uncharacterized protein (TIGR02453 family)